jgi:hypothetical protein
VREFRREHIPQVAALWLKAFRHLKEPASEALQNYFRKIFFEGPWRDESLPSLLYEEEGRGIVGFLGVFPRVMTFNGRPIKVAVATQLMVDEGAAYSAAKLMRKFFAGKQDLSLSDGCNDESERLWQAAGGESALLYSLNWIRVLRPTGYVISRLNRWEAMSAAKAPRLMCQALDAAVVRSWVGRYWLPETAGTVVEEDPADEQLHWCIRHLSGNPALQPQYELDSFRWLLSRAGEKKRHGALRKGLVRDATNGGILGWFLYYSEPGGIGQVLQFGGKPKSMGKVLNQLFYQAWKHGAIALSGKLDPRYARDLARNRCRLDWAGYGVVVQSRNREILNAVRQGDAFMSRLEGEWWLRFSDPSWSVEGGPYTGTLVEGVGELPEVPRLAPRIS